MAVGGDAEIDHAHHAIFGMRAARDTGEAQFGGIDYAAVAAIRHTVVEGKL